MSRQFGLSRREASIGGGFGKPPGSHGAGTRADLIPLPAASILLARNSFERRQVSEPLIDEREAGAVFLVIAFLSAIGGLLCLFYYAFQSFVP